jgi:hypothetical protein
MNLVEALAQAYHADQVERRRNEAVAGLRAAIGNQKDEAKTQLVALQNVIRVRGARTQHILVVQAGLLADALAE